MAHGDIVDDGLHGPSGYWSSWKLIDGATATTSGKWIDVRGFNEFSIDITGITTAVVRVYGSNAAAKPVDAADGRQIGQDITEDAFAIIKSPMRWIKAVVSSYTSGTISAILTAGF